MKTPSEIAKICNVTVRTIQYYRQIGLIPSSRRVGRIWVYDDDVIKKIKKIRSVVKHPKLSELRDKI